MKVQVSNAASHQLLCRTLRRSFAFIYLFTALPLQAQDFSTVNIVVERAGENVYALKGSGGNIGLLATEQGLVMIDSQFKPLAEKINQAMKSIAKQEIKYIVNTHYHGDHTGGNEVFAQQAPIFAHDNVRKRLLAKQDGSAAALPVVTYNDQVNIYLQAETIQLSHLPNGHTDGDTAVYFQQANVLHTGDLFFNDRFPFIDLNSGGSVEGYLMNVETLISNMPEDVVIIPGHGELSDLAGYRDFAQMLKFSIAKAKKAIAAGITETDFVNAGIGEKYQALAWAFITEEKWLKTLYRGLK
ncbi:MAG: MBL fold metallo-hydrolase [Thalassotalea sp.]